MSPRRRAAPSRRDEAPAFRLRFTLTLVYVGVFFLFYCFLLAAPRLAEVAGRDVPGAAQQQMAREAAYQAVRPKLALALAAAALTTGAGAYLGVLPGLRR